MGMFLKDPAARLDYAVDWSANIGAAAIAQSTWDVEPPGATVSATMATASRTGATIDGGDPGKIYRIVNRVTLTDGRIDDRSLVIRVEAR